MSKPIIFFVAGVLTTIACAAIVFLPTWLVATTFDLSNDGAVSYDLVKTIISPDGKRVATIYTASGAVLPVGAIGELLLQKKMRRLIL